MRKLITAAALAGALAALTACGTDKPADKSAAPPAPVAQTTAAAPAVQTLKTATVEGFTTFVTNAKGRTVYRFDKDTNAPAKSNCVDACVENWPLVLAGPDGSFALEGVDKSLVGTIDRPEGKQLTLKGWPLYYYKDDKTLGQTTGHGKGSTWFAIAPDGSKATTKKATSSY